MEKARILKKPISEVTISDISELIRELEGKVRGGIGGPYLQKLAQEIKGYASYLNPRYNSVFDPELKKIDDETTPGSPSNGYRPPYDNELTADELELADLMNAVLRVVRPFTSNSIANAALLPSADQIREIADSLRLYGSQSECEAKTAPVVTTDSVATSDEKGKNPAAMPLPPSPQTDDGEAKAPGQDEGTVGNTPVTLIEFMKKFCTPLSNILLDSRLKALQSAARRDEIELPKHEGKWKSGQSKKYRPTALVKAWPKYREKLPNLPELNLSR